MTRKVECRRCGTYNSAGTPCRCLKVAPDAEKDKFMLGVESEIETAVNNIENGNEYEGLLRLKGIQFALKIRREQGK